MNSLKIIKNNEKNIYLSSDYSELKYIYKTKPNINDDDSFILYNKNTSEFTFLFI
jgi:hypothetical protein